MKISVIGGGIIGLSCAYELAEAGHHVSVISREAAVDATSGASAAFWFPYKTEMSVRVLKWCGRTFKRFQELSAIPESHVRMESGLVIERDPEADSQWTALVDEFSVADSADLPATAGIGFRSTVPVICIPEYLPWLTAECGARGVVFESRAVESVEEEAQHADVVIVAAGLDSAALVDDPLGVYPIRGQVARLRNPGLRNWVTYDANPDGVTYAIPRGADVVCGGTTVLGEWDTAYDMDLEVEILERVYALVPELRGEEVLSRAVGLRPGRDSVRLERLDSYAVPVITCYGHGGAGVTESWGCAEEVRDLVGTVSP